MAMQRGSLEPLLKDEIVFHDWQVDGVRKLVFMPSFLLADEMGLGKSLQALTVFVHDVFMGYSQSCIIVCPPTLIGNWCNEIEKFTRIPYFILDGSPEKRTQTLVDFAHVTGPKILITNYEKISKHVKVLNALHFDAGIFDEAHYMKGFDSQRTTACHELLNGRSMLLTGTPMLGHVSDLWGLMKKIDPNGTPEYWTFINRYAVFGGYRDKQIIGIKNERHLRERMAKIMLRREAKDHLKLDEPYIISRFVNLDPEQRLIYDRIKSDMKSERPGDELDEDIKFDIVKNTRLKQAASNTLSFNGQDISPKLDLCMDDDAEIFENGQKVIVFTQFIEMKECYEARHRKRHGDKVPIFALSGSVPDAKRQPIVNQWSAVKGPAVIVCMIQVAGIGLNMVASHNIAMLDKLYVPGLNDQAIGRANRLGQTHPVTVREYRARDTVEGRVEVINKTKRRLFSRTIGNSPDWKKHLREKLIKEGRVV